MKDRLFPAVIVPAWRRPEALKRLLSSLLEADYSAAPAGEVTLVLSLDGGADPATIALAREFVFPAGTCEVVLHPENMGVRRHILWCGDQCRRFGSVIVLEEDLIAGPAFYRFAQAGLEAYRGVPQVAGVALYAPEFNEIARLPFVPADNGDDAYFMQFPCSSGQAWDLPSWEAFTSWLGEKSAPQTAGEPLRTNPVDRGKPDFSPDAGASADAGTDAETGTGTGADSVVGVDTDSCDNAYTGAPDGALPEYVAGWPASSWKKWYAAWLVETDRYMLYPCKSHTTNCSDPGGSHVSGHFQPDVQVSMPLGSPALATKPEWRFPEAAFPPEIAYDAYMEPCGALHHRLITRHIESGGGRNAHEAGNPDEAHPPASAPLKIQFDLHGRKPRKLLAGADWCVTLRRSSRPMARFPLTFRPIEANLAHPCENSRGFFVLSSPGAVGSVPPGSRYTLTRYYGRGSLFRADFLAGYLFFGVAKLLQRLGIRMKRFFRTRVP